MSFTVDGKRYKGNFEIKYGDEFIKRHHNYVVDLKGIGKCNIYLLSKGHPFWSQRMSVIVPVQFYITSVYEHKKAIKEKGHHLKLIK